LFRKSNLGGYTPRKEIIQFFPDQSQIWSTQPDMTRETWKQGGAGDCNSGSSRRAMIALIAGAALAFKTSPLSARAPVPPPVGIDIQSSSIIAFDPREPSRRKFGQLQFRGGLLLTSPFKHFGGLSAIRLAADGAQFIALSDHGWWLTGRIRYDGERPTGISDAMMAPILGPDGQALADHGWYDTESIAEDGGTLYVGIERVNRIVRLDYGKDGLTARAQPIDVPAGVRALPNNKGLEALVFVPRNLPLGGTLIAISERGLDKDGNLLAFLIGGPRPGGFAVKRSADFDVSDAALLPGGGLLILERKFSWISGLFIRIRRLALADVRPGALVDGPVLFEADLGYAIDNMEGLSVHRDTAGEIVLTLISDDNFSVLQRTLLLQFTLLEP
jgi:hypothetical protein